VSGTLGGERSSESFIQKAAGNSEKPTGEMAKDRFYPIGNGPPPAHTLLANRGVGERRLLSSPGCLEYPEPIGMSVGSPKV